METFFQKKNIEFSCSECPVDSEDNKQSHIGYNFITKGMIGAAIPNYNNNKVEFIILNQNLIEHLVAEGYSDEEIDTTGKVWVHVTKLSSFQKMFEYSEKINLN
jgi:hypothetical protein